MTHPLTIHDTAAAGPAGVASATVAQVPATEVGLAAAPESAPGLAADFPLDAGMSTVEYAVGTVVAAAFAAVLYRIVTGDSIVSGLTNLVQSALNTGF